MAITIPTPEDQGASSLGAVEGQAAQTPYQSLQLPDLAFNARTLGKLGDVLGSFSQEMQKRYEETKLLEVQQAYSEFERDLLYNLETGIMRTEKSGALGVTERAKTATEEFFTKYSQDNQTLTRSAAMAMQRYAQQRQISIIDAAARHEMTENERYRAELKAAASANAVATARLAFASDTTLAEQEQLIRTSTQSQFQDDPNVTPEQVDEITASRVDAMYRSAITGALMDDTKAGRARAAELLATATASGALKLTENDPIVRAVQFGTEEDGRSAQADMLVAQAGGDLAKAVEMAADLPNANATDRAKIVEEIETRMRSRERAATAAQKDLEARATALASKGELDSMSTAEQAMLPPELLDRLRRTNRGDVLESDLATLGFLASLSTQQWESVDLSTYAGKLTREDMEKFVAVKGKAMADLQNARNNPSPDMTVTTMIGTLADRAGLSGAAQKDARGNFTLAMISYVEAYRLENDGKAPSSEDLAAEADRLRLKVVTEEGIVYNTKKTVDEVLLSPPALVDDAGQPVPKADVQAFIRGVVAIQGEAAILTPEALQQLYLNYLANQ